MRSDRFDRRRLAALGVALLLPLTLWAVLPLPSHGQDAGALQGTIESSRARERTLSSAISRLAALEQRAERAITLLRGRLSRAQAELGEREAALARTRNELRAERRHLARLRARLERDRATLAAALRAQYTTTPPDLVTVVLTSSDFADLVDRAAFYKRVRRRNASVVTAVRRARDATQRETARLAVLAPRQARAAREVRAERDSLAAKTAALHAQEQTLSRARAARQAALRATTADRRRAERELRSLEAAQQRAAVDKRGPGGPWAIPWAIVQCESGGQNMPPNYAGASGYYQFIPSTWRALGGSTPHAYQAPKAEQDRLAAKLWAGGSGARNWDCAAIVGII